MRSRRGAGLEASLEEQSTLRAVGETRAARKLLQVTGSRESLEAFCRDVTYLMPAFPNAYIFTAYLSPLKRLLKCERPHSAQSRCPL